MKLLLHACCGPCSIYPLQVLLAEGHEVSGYFYNPNIHPYTEFKKRLDTFTQYMQKLSLPHLIDDAYELEAFLRQAVYRETERCQFCYETRLKKTAQSAFEQGFEAFTTTLLVSPYQDQTLIQAVGQRVGQEVGVPFYFRDFRPGYREGVRRSKEENMYC